MRIKERLEYISLYMFIMTMASFVSYLSYCEVIPMMQGSFESIPIIIKILVYSMGTLAALGAIASMLMIYLYITDDEIIKL